MTDSTNIHNHRNRIAMTIAANLWFLLLIVTVSCLTDVQAAQGSVSGNGNEDLANIPGFEPVNYPSFGVLSESENGFEGIPLQTVNHIPKPLGAPPNMAPRPASSSSGGGSSVISSFFSQSGRGKPPVPNVEQIYVPRPPNGGPQAAYQLSNGGANVGESFGAGRDGLEPLPAQIGYVGFVPPGLMSGAKPVQRNYQTAAIYTVQEFQKYAKTHPLPMLPNEQQQQAGGGGMMTMGGAGGSMANYQFPDSPVGGFSPQMTGMSPPTQQQQQQAAAAAAAARGPGAGGSATGGIPQAPRMPPPPRMPLTQPSFATTGGRPGSPIGGPASGAGRGPAGTVAVPPYPQMPPFGRVPQQAGFGGGRMPPPMMVGSGQQQQQQQPRMPPTHQQHPFQQPPPGRPAARNPYGMPPPRGMPFPPQGFGASVFPQRPQQQQQQQQQRGGWVSTVQQQAQQLHLQRQQNQHAVAVSTHIAHKPPSALRHSPSGQQQQQQQQPEKIRFNYNTDNERIMEALLKQVESLHAVIYSRRGCRECQEVEYLLQGTYKVPTTIFYLDKLTRGKQLLQFLGDIVGNTSVPKVFICGYYIGGHEEVMKLHRENQLKQYISKCFRRPSNPLQRRRSKDATSPVAEAAAADPEQAANDALTAS